MADDDDVGEEGGGGSKKILIIVLIVLLLGAAGAAYFFFFASTSEDAVEEVVEVGPSGEPLEVPFFLELGSSITNLLDGRRYLKANIQLMISEESVKLYLEGRIAEVKDITIATLQELSAEEVKTQEGREALKQRLIENIGSLFPSDPDWEDKNPIRKVLFTEFHMQ